MVNVDSSTILCLFSFVCFGQVRRFLPSLAPGCQIYKYDEDIVSIVCPPTAKLSQLTNTTIIHALSITGQIVNGKAADLAWIPFKHLIVQDGYLPDDTSLRIDGERLNNRYHHSFTAIRSFNLAAWDWSLFDFKHVHLESSVLHSFEALDTSIGLTLKFPSTLLSLAIVDCRLTAVYDGAFSSLKSLQSFTLSRNTLSSFPRSALPDEAKDLWLIDLSQNELKSLDGNFFHGLPALKEINLSSNNLAHLSWDMVKPVWYNLNLLDLRDNPWICSDFCWIFNKESLPLFVDQSTCSSNGSESYITLGLANKKALGCAQPRKRSTCCSKKGCSCSLKGNQITCP